MYCVRLIVSISDIHTCTTLPPVFWLVYMNRLYYRSRLEHKIKSLLISYLEHTDDITVPKWASALIPSLKYSILVISFKSSFVWYYIYPSWSWKHGSILLYFVTLATTWCKMFQHQFRIYISHICWYLDDVSIIQAY